MSKIFSLIFTLLIVNIHLLSESHTVSKKYQLSVGALFKNKAKNLKEWIEYHRIVGVDHFYLYNNNSRDRYLDVLDPYIRSGIVTLIQWPDFLGPVNEEKVFLWSLSTQISAYENALHMHALKETKWLVFIDVDEYLVPPNADKLTDILEKYKEYPGVILASDFFDADKNYALPKRKVLIETTQLTCAPKLNIQKSVAKMLFQPEQCKGFIWPPYQCVFKDQRQPITLRKPEMRINQYLQRDIGYFHLGKTLLHVDNRTLTDEELSEILENNYEIEDQERSIYRFIPELLERMGYRSALP